MYKLVIAEKPSMAESIAKVIGSNKKNKGYWEGNGYIVSWCIGHLAELCYPESYDEKYAKWKTEDLPIIPKEWKYEIDKKKKEQFYILKSLMFRDDVTEVINACDAGREGERIFRTVYNLIGCQKPIKRLWVSSLEDRAIKEGFENLKPGKEYDNLYAASECRAKADWLVGMNISRLLSTSYRAKLRAGRVLSPTLNFIVERQNEIENFKSEPYFNLELKNGNTVLVSDKFSSKEEADKTKEFCLKNPVLFNSLKTEEKKEKAPLLYDLTYLQREANRIYGFTAQQTLDYVQSLYEKKLCTYPRTDSRFLTDDMAEVAEKLFPMCTKLLNKEAEKSDSIKLCNSKKVSDHHALIPTMTVSSYDIESLPQGEKKILFLISRRLLEAASKEYVSKTNTYIFTCGDYVFSVKQTSVIQQGWKIYGKQENKKDTFNFSGFKQGDVYKLESLNIKEGKTKPKAAYTEDTLLFAMETAGKDDIPEDAERQGIGTPATRAEVIERLIKSGYVMREKKNLIPYDTGKNLVSVLPDSLKSVLLTAEWEQKLKQVETGTLSPETFIEEIETFVTDIIKNYKVIENCKDFRYERKTVGKCLRCNSEIYENQKGYFCKNEKCSFKLWKGSKYLEPKNIMLNTKTVEVLLKNGKVHINKIRSGKTGKFYSGTLYLMDDGKQTSYKIEPDFKKRNQK